MTFDPPSGLRALLAGAILALAAVPARADGGVGVVVTGEATMQPQLVAHLETWLRTHGHDLVSAPLPPDAINALIDCMVIEDQACARRVVEKRSKSRSVVFAQVSVTAGATAIDRTVTLTAHWLDKGKDAVAERRECKRCTDTTMRSSADDMMTALTGASLDRGVLKLTSTPPGAKVIIGGKTIGETPLEYSLPSGDHDVVLKLAGRRSETRSVAIKKGQTAAVDVELAVKPPEPSRALAYTALGGGVALALAGGVLIALDQDQPTGNGPQEPTYFDSALGGVALAAGGAVVFGVGVYLLVRQPGRSTTPAVGLVPGGGVIGWAGRF